MENQQEQENKGISYDPESVKEFIEKLFNIEKELLVLRDDIKQLKDEYKGKLNQKLVSKIIRLVKLKVSLSEENASEQTIEEIENVVKDKVNMVL